MCDMRLSFALFPFVCCAMFLCFVFLQSCTTSSHLFLYYFSNALPFLGPKIMVPEWFSKGPLNARQAFCYIALSLPFFVCCKGVPGVMVASRATDPASW